MAKAANRLLGMLQQFQIGTFNTVAAGASVNYVFNNMPEFAPGGSYYEVLDIILRFPVGAVQFTVPANQIVTARTLWSVIQQMSFTFGGDSVPAKMRGGDNPEIVSINAPGAMLADFFALHSRSMIADVDRMSAARCTALQSGVVTTQPFAVAHATFDRRGYAYQHGPYAQPNGVWGAANQLDIYLPFGRRANGFEAEDIDDVALPAHWLHGKALNGGVAGEPARMNITMAATGEGGAAFTLAVGQIAEVWVNALVRRPGRAACPAIPNFRFNQPPANSQNIVFVPGYHFYSGFTAQDTTGRGNVNANLDVLTQTFGTVSVQCGSYIARYNNALEYLGTLNAFCGQQQVDPGFSFAGTDDPIQPISMAVVRERMGLFPMAVPLPVLLSMSTDQDNDLLFSYTAPNPVSPFQLQSYYPLWTPEAQNDAARKSGIPNAVCMDAVDSYAPEDGISPFLPKTIRQRAA